MKNTLLRSIKLLMIVAAISFSCFACDKVENIDDPPIDVPVTENNDTVDESITEEVTDEIDDKEKQFESPLLSSSPYLHGSLAVVENKIKVIMGPSGLQEEYQIYDDQVITIKCDRYIFLKDGSIIDHEKKSRESQYNANIKESFEPEDWDKYLNKPEISEDILNEWHKSVGIKDIRADYVTGRYYVFLANGDVFTMGTEFNTVNSEGDIPDRTFEERVLDDGTLNCPQFPETEEWTDIVDYRMASNFILALTSDGKLLSSGIEFEHENIVKFDIWDVCTWDSNIGDMPVALTSDGKLIFGEFTSLDPIFFEKWDKQIETAKTFTDVEDFTFYGPNDDLYIIVQKTDGSIWATQYIDVFSEYVNIPNGVKISYDGEELPLPIPEYCCAQCDAVIPQGMSECPECSAS